MFTKMKYIALVACSVAAIGSVMPWVSLQSMFGTMNISGTDGDGIITMFLAALAWGFCFFGKRTLLILATFACGVGIAVSIYEFINLGTKIAGEDEISVSIGYGLYICLAAFVVGFFALLSLSRNSTPSEAVVSVVAT